MNARRFPAPRPKLRPPVVRSNFDTSIDDIRSLCIAQWPECPRQPGATGDGAAPQRELFWQFRKFSAVRRGSWKLVRSDPKKPWELYDLDHDLGEHDDLALKNPELVRKLADAPPPKSPRDRS